MFCKNVSYTKASVITAADELLVNEGTFEYNFGLNNIDALADRAFNISDKC